MLLTTAQFHEQKRKRGEGGEKKEEKKQHIEVRMVTLLSSV
jgi:hypothetical protein